MLGIAVNLVFSPFASQVCLRGLLLGYFLVLDISKPVALVIFANVVFLGIKGEFPALFSLDSPVLAIPKPVSSGIFANL